MNLAESPRLAAALPYARPIPLAWRAAKRGTDIAVSLAILAVTLPFMLFAMLGIVLVSPGSPIFMQERVGQNGRRFKMFKLRTMVDGAHLMLDDIRHLNEVDGPVFKIRNDPRLHLLGPLLRRTSLDEIPNFVNVLIGDMSVVGPRPPLPHEVDNYDQHATLRLTIKPGITCLWQISGRSNVSFDDWVELDREYIETWTPWGDLVLILRTIPVVIRGEGAH
jgi:lipopolysaccharide/colanic/teichoic acid biosynthesis glycosyltransferase